MINWTRLNRPGWWMSGLSTLLLLLVPACIPAEAGQQGAWTEQFDAGKKCFEDQYADCDPHLYIERALTIAEREHAPPPEIARILDFRARLAPVHWDEASRDVTHAIHLVESVSGKDSPNLVPLFEHLASIREHQGDLEQARNILGLCLQIRVKAFGPESAQAALSTSYLGVFYEAHGPQEKAEELLRRGLAIALKSHDTNATLNAYAQLSGFMRANGRAQEADDFQKMHFELSIKQPSQQPADPN